MLEAFNPEVHHQLNRLACDADRIKELVFWAYGANELSHYQYKEICKDVERMRETLLVLETLEKKFHFDNMGV